MKLTDLAHELWSNCLHGGESVIDATAGNGYDALFLAKCVAPNGEVFAFDVQEKAIHATAALLKEHKCSDQVHIIQDSHVSLKKYIPENVEIHATVFNLGYLPDGDHTITTHASTSLAAIKLAWDMLAQEGFLSVMTYPGHEQGLIEHETLFPLLKELLDKNEGKHITPQTKFRRSPELFFIKKNK